MFQGPKEGTLADFWQMVHEQRSEVVVMLTRTVEAGSIRKVWVPGLALWLQGDMLQTKEGLRGIKGPCNESLEMAYLWVFGNPLIERPLQ